MKFNFSFGILKWLLGLAIASFFISLWLPYIGEEGVYTISSYEMWYHHHFLYPTLFGLSYWRPPLFNWFIILVTHYTGWNNMLVAARLVAAAATIASSFVLMWLAKHLFKTSGFGLFAALIYLTSDALFYHGWLAYADPLFAFFTSSAIALLWVSNLEKRYSLIWLAALALIAAFMTKALTTYVFYVVALIFIVYYDGRQHAFILKTPSTLTQLLAFSFPFLWNFIVHGITGKAMLGDISHKFFYISSIAYVHQIIFFPLEVFSRFLPASILTLYYFFKKKLQKISFNSDVIKTLIGIIFINFIPYWVVPNTGIRYLLPLYPFIALFIAILLWHLPKQAFNIVIVWLSLAVLIKYIGLIFLFYYQCHFRGDYKQIAQQIIMASQGFPLYSNDDVATGLSTTALIDNLLYPHSPLEHSLFSKGRGKDYFLISDQRNAKLGKLYKVFPIGKQGTPIYLLCHGSACNVN